MRVAKYILAIILLSALQSSVCPTISIFQITPNILIPFVVVTALIEGPVTGAVVGAAVGMFADAFSSGTVILFTITYMYIAVVCGYIHHNYLRENVMIAIMFSFLGTCLALACSFFLHFSIWGRGHIFTALWRVILPTAIYSAVLTIPIYYLFQKFRSKRSGEAHR